MDGAPQSSTELITAWEFENMSQISSIEPSIIPASSERFAPVAVFAYMRPWHLQCTIESLLRNPEAVQTDVYFFCDEAKRPQNRDQVEAVRRYVATVHGFRSTTAILRERNLGLAQSIINGVSTLLNKYERIIVLEDDLILSRHFLRYMNDGLIHYQHNEKVASIHAYSYPTQDPLPETFFLQGADCWGWGTWARAWRHFETDGLKLLNELQLRGLTHDFDFDGCYPYTQMLVDQISGRNSSWAIRWHATCYLKGLLTLYPGRTLVENIGNDSSGTHCIITNAMSRAVTDQRVNVDRIPVEQSLRARAAFRRFLLNQRSWSQRLRKSIRHMLTNQI
jgi:hypothetical protein